MNVLKMVTIKVQFQIIITINYDDGNDGSLFTIFTQDKHSCYQHIFIVGVIMYIQKKFIIILSFGDGAV